MKKTPAILLLLSLLLLAGCNDPKPVTDALHRAEALMNEHPDSAWAVLNTVSSDEMGQNRTRAHYALLYTQAQDKTYRDETNDSLISVAVDYYRDTDDVRRKFLSYYYKGRVHFNSRDYLNAMTCYMEAEQLVDEVDDDYLAGLLYAEQGRIYDIYYDYPKSLEAYQKAAERYERAGKIRHRNYMWYNQSNVCRNLNRYAEGEKLLLMALERAKSEDDKSLLELCLGSLVMLCVEQDRMPEARDFYAELEPLVDAKFASPAFMGCLSEIYVAEHNYPKAKQCIEKGWDSAETRMDSVRLFLSSSIVLNAMGQEKSAYQEVLKGVVLQNQEARQALQQPVLTAQRDYLSEKLAFEAYRLRMEKRLKILYVLVSLLFLTLTVYVSIRIIRKNKVKSQLAINELKRQKEKTEEEKKQAEKDKENLVKENRKISSLLHRMETEKSIADQTIKELKEEIFVQGKNADMELSVLLQKMAQEEEEAHRSIEELKQKLAQKEESRNKMDVLIKKMEDESRLNAETITGLRASMEQMEADYAAYIQKTENVQLGLQEQYHQLSTQAFELFRKRNSDMSKLFVIMKEKKVAVSSVCKIIHRWEEEFLNGETALSRLEKQVNLYCEDAMSHFREEVKLGGEKDYHRVCYWFAGLSMKAVSQLMKESKDSVYQCRLRLRERIEDAGCLHGNMFVKLLGK